MRIHQEVTLNSSLEKIYGTLMNATKFSEATGAPAEIVDEEGGAFSCFGGQITGNQIINKIGGQNMFIARRPWRIAVTLIGSPAHQRGSLAVSADMLKRSGKPGSTRLFATIPWCEGYRPVTIV